MNQNWLSDSEFILEWSWFAVGIASAIVAGLNIFSNNCIERLQYLCLIILVVGSIGIVYGRWHESDRYLYIFPKFHDWDYFALSLFVFVECVLIAIDTNLFS